MAAVVAGIVGYCFLKRFLDREMPEVAQFPDTGPVLQLPDNETGRRIADVINNPDLRVRRERPQRHEEPMEHSSGAEIGG